MRILLAAALLAGTAATPALAQDAPVSAAGTGPRIEALVGYDMPKDFDNGVMYGVGVGFDFALGGVTAGIEGEYLESEADETFFEPTDPTNRLRAELGRDLYVGGRVGVASFGGSALYLKGGYTNLDVVGSLTGSGFSVGGSEKLDGYRVGAGAEFGVPIINLGSAAFAKAEYRYSNYEQGVERHQVLGGIGFRF